MKLFGSVEAEVKAELAKAKTMIEHLGSVIETDLKDLPGVVAKLEARVVAAEAALASFAPAIQSVMALLPAGSPVPAEVTAVLAMLPK
jgi:hypothetical protein